MAAEKKTKSKTVKKTARKTAAKAKKTPAKAVKTETKKAASKKKVVSQKKTPVKKKALKKKAPLKKKTAKKTSAKKTGVAEKKTVKKNAKKAPAGKKAATKKASKKKASTSENEPRKGGGVSAEEITRRVTEALRERSGSKREEDGSPKGQPTVFTLEDVREYLKSSKATAEPEIKPKKTAKTKTTPTPAKPKTPVSEVPARPKQKFGAASVADLLGFDPTADSSQDKASKSNDDGIPKKFLPYFRALVALHEQVYEGLHRHSEETLHRSNKEDSGDLSGYGQHMADAGTDSFDRDFALSMVSSEQEALYEIDEAIRRIRDGSYGVCEITGKSISRERLKAVPFTRYSVEGQMEVERGRKRTVQKAGIQGFDGDDAPVLSDDDSDD